MYLNHMAYTLPLLISCHNFFGTQLYAAMQVARTGVVELKLTEDGRRGNWGEDDPSCRTGSPWTCIGTLPIFNG